MTTSFHLSVSPAASDLFLKTSTRGQELLVGNVPHSQRSLSSFARLFNNLGVIYALPDLTKSIEFTIEQIGVISSREKQARSPWSE